MLTAHLPAFRTIGAEFEMAVPCVGVGGGLDVQRTLATVLSANGVRALARPYCREPVPAGVDVTVEHDSSIRGETRYAGIVWHSVEIKTRVLNGIADWEEVVPKSLDIARYLGARVNATCGHHVHIGLPEVGMRPKVIRSLVNLVGRIEPVIYGMVAPSRRSSGFCLPMANSLPNFKGCETLSEHCGRLIRTTRYYGCNLTHLTSTPPRVEYRWHQGTLDTTKARHWLRFLLRVTEHAAQRSCQSFAQPLANDRRGWERMATAIGLRVNSKIYRSCALEVAETATYLLRRWKHFNGQPLRSPTPTLSEQAAEREVA
ncbi:MAG: amidoligase family protein [Tepidisphaeraceae bacterium]